METMDVEDEVVECVPVFLNKTLADHIYVLQYPVLNESVQLNAEVASSCIKPQTHQLKIDFLLNTDSNNYDAFKGDQLAHAADGKTGGKNVKEKEKLVFPSGRMDRQTYLNSVSGQNVDRFVVCVMKDKEVHLTPIQQIYQMRPSFSYFDKQDQRTTAEKKEEDSAEEEEVKQVTVKFAKNENERTRKNREKSFNYLNQIKDEEPWCQTKWYEATSAKSANEKEKLIRSGMDNREDFFDLAKDVYAKCLVSNADEVIEITQPKTEEIVRAALTSARVVPFSMIQKKLTTKNVEKAITALQAVGTMIRGNWVLKSDLLYPTETVSYTNGVAAHFMVRAREFVLYKFSVQDALERQYVTQCTQLPTEEAKEVLESVAKFEPGTGWVMLVPPNDEFEAKHAELVARRKAYWDGKQSEFHEMEMNRLHKPNRKRSHRDSK